MYDHLFTIGTFICLTIAAAALTFGLAAALITGRLTPAPAAFSILCLYLLLSALRTVWRELRANR